MSKIAVVTGSNQGIGFAIVKALCKQFNGLVYLTARNIEAGQKAVESLKKEGLSPEFHQLDIDDINSINKFAAYLKEKHGGLDILVNNAAIAYKANDQTPFHIQAEHTNRVNFFGTLNVCNALFRLLRSHARVVNVSSRGGLLKIISNEKIRRKLSNENTTVDDIIAVLHEFIGATKEDKHESLGYPSSAYGMSKVGVTALTRVQQRQFDRDSSRSDIVVSACCPGYVSTNMSSYKGHLTIEQGAETPVYLALLPENTNEPKGEFWAEMKVHPWVV